MAGFGAAKEAKEAKDAKEAVPFTPLKQKKNKTSNNPKEGQSNFVEKAYDASNDPFADLRNELQSLHKKSPKSTLFGLIAGHENTGKTAIVLLYLVEVLLSGYAQTQPFEVIVYLSFSYQK